MIPTHSPIGITDALRSLRYVTSHNVNVKAAWRKKARAHEEFEFADAGIKENADEKEKRLES